MNNTNVSSPQGAHLIFKKQNVKINEEYDIVLTDEIDNKIYSSNELKLEENSEINLQEAIDNLSSSFESNEYNYLLKLTDIMTGPLYLTNEPQEELEISTKKYIDDLVIETFNPPCFLISDNTGIKFESSTHWYFTPLEPITNNYKIVLKCVFPEALPENNVYLFGTRTNYTIYYDAINENICATCGVGTSASYPVGEERVFTIEVLNDTLTVNGITMATMEVSDNFSSILSFGILNYNNWYDTNTLIYSEENVAVNFGFINLKIYNENNELKYNFCPVSDGRLYEKINSIFLYPVTFN